MVISVLKVVIVKRFCAQQFGAQEAKEAARLLMAYGRYVSRVQVWQEVAMTRQPKTTCRWRA